MRHTPLELTRLAAARLEQEGIESARLDAELLLAAVLGLRRLDLYLQHDRPLTPAEVDAYRAALRRRLRREPLQYITGEAAFRDLVVRVDPRVLIPRPETEVLVEAVLEWAGDRTGLRAVDIGTGSGVIALALAQDARFERVVATDASSEALELAAANAAGAGLAERLELRRGSVYEPLAGQRFDVIVSNPPYVGEEERASLQPEVRDWEPAAALFAGPAGLDVLQALVDGAAERLNPGGLLALEVGLGQARLVAERLRAVPRFAEPRVRTDLTGRERVVLAELCIDPERK